MQKLSLLLLIGYFLVVSLPIAAASEESDINRLRQAAADVVHRKISVGDLQCLTEDMIIRSRQPAALPRCNNQFATGPLFECSDQVVTIDRVAVTLTPQLSANQQQISSSFLVEVAGELSGFNKTTDTVYVSVPNTDRTEDGLSIYQDRATMLASRAIEIGNGTPVSFRISQSRFAVGNNRRIFPVVLLVVRRLPILQNGEYWIYSQDIVLQRRLGVVEAPDVCGDGFTTRGEACDDGNRSVDDYCSAECDEVTGWCGDGILQTGKEECDDGNQTEDDSCSQQSFCQETYQPDKHDLFFLTDPIVAGNLNHTSENLSGLAPSTERAAELCRQQGLAHGHPDGKYVAGWTSTSTVTMLYDTYPRVHFSATPAYTKRGSGQKPSDFRRVLSTRRYMAPYQTDIITDLSGKIPQDDDIIWRVPSEDTPNYQQNCSGWVTNQPQGRGKAQRVRIRLTDIFWHTTDYPYRPCSAMGRIMCTRQAGE